MTTMILGLMSATNFCMVQLEMILRLLPFFLIIACAKLPDTGNAPPMNNLTPDGNCKVKLAASTEVDGMMCPAGHVALGVSSLSPSRIRCAQVDVEC